MRGDERRLEEIRGEERRGEERGEAISISPSYSSCSWYIDTRYNVDINSLHVNSNVGIDVFEWNKLHILKRQDRRTQQY